MDDDFRSDVKMTVFLRKLLYGGAWILFAVYGIAFYSFSPPDLLSMNHTALLLIWTMVSLPVVAVLYRRDITGIIGRSNERMSDPEYRQKLAKLGYLNESSNGR